MKQIILQKLAVIVMLCFFFQNAQAQLDDGKFPDKLRPPMIDNIVVFNPSLIDFVVSIQEAEYGMANVTDESGNYNPNQNIEEVVIVDEVEDSYFVESKAVEINKGEENEIISEETTEEESEAWFPNPNHQQNNYFDADVLAELVSAYPNPVQNTLTVEVKENLLLNVQLFNTLGQLVHTQNSAGIGKVQIDVQDFAKGTYFLNIISDTKRVVEKIQIIK